MKNKVLISIVILLILVVGLCACTPTNNATVNVCATINEMAKMGYQTIKLSVYTTQNDVTLTSEFWASITDLNTMVTYSVESLNTFTTDDDGNYVVPSEMTSKKTGSATIKNGAIVESSGEDVNIPVEALSGLSLNFDDSYLSNENIYPDGTDNVLEAKVDNPAMFTNNWDFDGTDMMVQVRYGEKLETVIIDYLSANGATIKVIYKFA